MQNQFLSTLPGLDQPSGVEDVEIFDSVPCTVVERTGYTPGVYRVQSTSVPGTVVFEALDESEVQVFASFGPEPTVCRANDPQIDESCPAQVEVDQAALPKTFSTVELPAPRRAKVQDENQINLPELKRNQSSRDTRMTDSSWYAVRNGPAPPWTPPLEKLTHKVVSILDKTSVQLWISSIRNAMDSLEFGQRAANLSGSILSLFLYPGCRFAQPGANCSKPFGLSLVTSTNRRHQIHQFKSVVPQNYFTIASRFFGLANYLF